MLKSGSPGRQRAFKTAIPSFYDLLPWIIIFLYTVEPVSASSMLVLNFTFEAVLL